MNRRDTWLDSQDRAVSISVGRLWSIRVVPSHRDGCYDIIGDTGPKSCVTLATYTSMEEADASV